MKRKLLSITAVLLICLTSMFMFAGCGAVQDSAAAARKYGTLACDKTEIELTVNVTEGKTHFVIGDRYEYLNEAELKFSFTPPASEKNERGEEKYPNSKLAEFKELSFKDARLKGLTASSMSLGTETATGEKRYVTFSYSGAQVKVAYTVKHKVVEKD